MKNIKAILVCFCGVFAMSTIAVAQEDSAQQESAQQENAGAAAEMAVDDATVDKFVVAYQDIVALQQDYSQQIQAAGDQQQAQQLQQEAQQKMMGAVKDAGLTIQEYNTIIQKAQNDPQFAEQIQNDINE